MATATQQEKRFKKPADSAPLDATMLSWSNILQKWFIPTSYEHVSKAYWEWVYQMPIEFGKAFYSPDFKQRTKFIRPGEAIN